MKKTLSLVLAVLMMLSCVVISAGAAEVSVGATEETTAKTIIPFNNCDSMSGWTGWREAMPSLDTTVYAEGTGSVTLSREGVVENALPGTVFQFHYTNRNNRVNITNAQALVFDLYIANVAGIEDVPFNIELNSDGNMDTDEISGNVYLRDLVDGGLKEGWNTAVLPISSLPARKGSFDATKCCFFRISNGAVTIGTEGKTTTMKLDNLRFLADASDAETEGDTPAQTPDSTEDLLFADCDAMGSVQGFGTENAKGSGWWSTGISPDLKEKTQGKASLSTTFQGLKAAAPAGTIIQFMYHTDKTIDITSKNAVAFDVYLENAEGVLNNTFEIELRSTGWTNATGDGMERNTVASLATYTVGTFGDGWNHIEIPLKHLSVNGKFDPTQCCYFRIFNRTGDIGTAGKKTVFKLDNVRFINIDPNGAPRTTTVTKYFASGAIYQQNKPLTIWGEGPVGTKLRAELYAASGSTPIATDEMTIGEDYQWLLSLDGQKGGYNAYTVKLYVDDAIRSTATDVLFGEVWLASGQSNMEMILNNTYEGKELMDAAEDEYLRIFNQIVTPPVLDTPQADAAGNWVYGNKPTSLASVSAIGYTFGTVLREALNVPVAVISAARGATRIESWLSKDTIDGCAEVKDAMLKNGTYIETPALPADMSAMYNAKIHPLTNLSIAGVIWYQGESSIPYGELYDEHLNLLQDSWGRAFGFEEGKMPLVFSQVAPYTRSGSPAASYASGAALKQSMLDFYLSHEDSAAMVTIYDLSLRYRDTATENGAAVIHPTVKQPVGERMARAALGLCYDFSEFTAPTVKDITWKDGVATVTFDHVGIGLLPLNDADDVLGFTLGNESGLWVNAICEIVDSRTVKVYNPYMTDAVYVAYAWSDLNDDATLVSLDGMPVAPFCSGGKGGAGLLSYLDCEGDLFVTTSFETGTPQGSGAAAYTNLWTILERAQVSYDTESFAQGAASLHVAYEAGSGEAVVGVDLTEAMVYTVGSPFKNIKTVTARLSNADATDKQVRLRIVLPTKVLYTNPVTLKANANFDTLAFDLTHLFAEDGKEFKNTAGKSINTATGFAFCIEDANAGEVNIDAILLGTDACVESEPEDSEQPTPADKPETPSENGGDNTAIIIVIAIVAIVVIAAAVAVVIIKKKKK